MTTLSIDERQQLAKSVRAACERLSSEERVRAVAYNGIHQHKGFDAELWTVLCSQVGVTAIALPENLGGAGYGASALGAVAHELGRSLAAVPFVASAVLATTLLVAAQTEQPEVDRRLAGLVEGSRTAAAVITSDGGLWRPDAIPVTAEQSTAGWVLTGTARHILHGSAADDLVVVATIGEVPALFVLDAMAPEVFRKDEQVLDHTRPMATITFSSAPATLVSRRESIPELVSRTMDLTMAVLSAEQVGACERLLEISTEYARTRHQFNRPIGSFQAVKHKCADTLVDLEWARSASQAALEAMDDGLTGESTWYASMAKAVCSEALQGAAHVNVQIHGGLGFTWEDSAHLYLRRARTDEVLFGKPSEHWDRLALESGIFTGGNAKR
ncbi:acyl-CoA dehydrogenase family protein [Mycolicibacterium thermoresistibile]|uniref:Acyl-CoA dehydrogenase protein n=2 Tax=Mycolicibacterium thermoresistibile TaxID=1797 RepID=G7CHZ3_MYCT3|nr:acyl-CoA dehydrogenase family protein [Mycolicibacterium thermoresistibile]EHI12453.1 acyl-CoA dehydrogenase protein [Mycolicibacterium thermoresistibile ATCC 19527]MCV7187364.1 acyl-CoA/acyl-ACP dehydrogenase [Mycolicibacterium thermoresistibile]GAT17221.1 acyl-CoA dehydrogenase protein [Mycolicibacterium thermoresistibile]SNW19627.1 acyl-CoA dehydrogenase protein [Mycolicibacterium thermoresistibile]